MKTSKCISYFVAIGLCLMTVSCSKAQLTGGKVYPDRINDGIYEGSHKSGIVKATVNVTIDKGLIKKIEIMEHRTMKGKKAEAVIPASIIKEQSTHVDAVSGGATQSSCVIMNAVQDAVVKASK